MPLLLKKVQMDYEKLIWMLKLSIKNLILIKINLLKSKVQLYIRLPKNDQRKKNLKKSKIK